MIDVCKQYLGKLIKVECQNGNTNTGELIATHDDFLELEHRNGLRTLIAYNQIAVITEIPRKAAVA